MRTAEVTHRQGTEQMDALLRESHFHFLARNLKKALNAAQIALDFARQSKSEQDILKASLLVATIYNTNGRYLSEPSFFAKANTYLEEIEPLALRSGILTEVDFYKTKSEILLNTGNYEEARALLGKAIVKSTGHPRAEIQLLSLRSHLELLSGNYQEALDFVQRGLEMLERNNELEKDRTLVAEIYNQMAQVLIKRNDFSRALEYSQKVLSLSRELKDAEKELSALNTMAIVSSVKSNYKIAMQYFQEVLDKSEAIGFRHNIAHCLINIGTIYAHLYNYDDALERYDQVLLNYRDTLDDYTKVVIFNNVGNIHYTTDKPLLAKEYFEKALTYAQEKHFKEESALALAQLSRTHTAIDDLKQAEILAYQALEQIELLGDINGKQINLINLGDISFRKKEYHKALELVEKGIEAARKLHDDASEIKGSRLLAHIYETLGEYQKAYELLSAYSTMQEAFVSVQQSRQFMDLEIKNALKEKQKEIEQLTKENEYQALLLEKSDQIERQNQELLQMNEDLRQFAYVASHDLKEPLRMIGSYAQILERMYGSKLDEKAKTYFGYMIEGVARMNSLLDALLKYATVGKSDEEFEQIDLNYMVEVSRVNLSVLIKETKAKITNDHLPTIYGSKSLLVQLFQNLLTNAIKFRKPDTLPEIHINCVETADEYQIRIRDNGIGIALENKERIFVIFQRLHPRSKYDGTGIGLAICQKIIHRMGGRLWVESELGKGSTFIFALPK